MITLTPNQLLVFANKPIVFCHTIKIEDDTGIIKAITSYHSNLVIDGVTYLADGSLLGLDPPKITTSVDREQFKFQLADPGFLEGNEAEYGYIGKEIEIRTIFQHPTTKEMLINLEDTLLNYSGYGDGTSYLIDSKEFGEVVLQVSCSSPLADLDGKRSMYASRDYVRGRNFKDSSCDMVYSGSGKLQLKWGKG
jgi:hypothetical protein